MEKRKKSIFECAYCEKCFEQIDPFERIKRDRDIAGSTFSAFLKIAGR